MQVKRQQPKRGAGGRPGDAARVHPETVARIERSMGTLGTAAIAAMDERLPWFRKMTAENRSWLGLVAQAGIASFVDWIKHPERMRPAATEVFGTAPRELARAVRLQQAVEMVRVIINVVEGQVDALAAPGAEAELREAVLVYAREIAFSAAQVYARTAEARGAWDARLEALVVDSLVRGEGQESLNSWASALNWSSSPVSVLAGAVDGDDAEPVIDELRAAARRARLDLLAGVQGGRLIVVLGGTDDPMAAAEKLAGLFGAGPARRRARPCGTCGWPTPPRGRPWPGCGSRPPGRTRRARSARTNCCPSARLTATRTRCGSWSPGLPAAAGRRHGPARHAHRLPGAGVVPRGHRPACSSSTRTRSATGCAGSPSSPATPRPTAATASPSGPRSSSAASPPAGG